MPGEPFTFKIDGMSCAGCAGRVERALQGMTGVEYASVNSSNHTVQVELGDACVKELTEVLAIAGYRARETKVQLSISGMSCASCTGRVENALLAVPGVSDASVNFATQSAHVLYLSGSTDAATLAQVVTNAGYPAVPTGDDGSGVLLDHAGDVQHARRRFVIAAGLALPVFVMEMGSHFIPGMKGLINNSIGQQSAWLLQFVLTSLVLAWPGRSFFRVGLPALLRGAPEMNSLVALGTIAAWGYSTVALFAPSILPDNSRNVYFEAAAVIVALILLGRWMEARARGQTGAAIEKLIGLQPKSVRVERDGKIQDIAIESVVIGDLIHVRPGARIPVDGIVVKGHSFVDESMMTGEPIPASKTEGHNVIGGTTNGNNALIVRATHIGRDTVLAQIVKTVERAQGSKLPIQSLADKVVRVFVPAVLLIALITVAVWIVVGPDPALTGALVAGVSVLIIACPCAMGLATPTSIMIGTGRAAEMGVLFRKGDALQRLESTRIIAFDKTGTLTQGRPEVVDVALASGFDRDQVLRLAIAAERHSEHPVARAIENAGRDLNIPDVQNVSAIPGYGVTARTDDQNILIGAARLLDREGIDTSELQDRADQMAQQGQTLVFVTIDGQLAAVIGVADTIKPTSHAVITALHAKGLSTAMITGDNDMAANAIADELGIDHVVANVLPDGKIQAIHDLRDAHGEIAFVGDGINDAPALVESDVGIAVGTGTDIAIEAADIVLMSGDLSGVLNAHTLSSRTMTNIRQNLFWAFAYNAALIPIAAGLLFPVLGVLLSPMLAAGAMALSSVFVISNALRLRHVNPAMTLIQTVEGSI